MIFVYKKWAEFCADLNKKGMLSIPACEVEAHLQSYIVLKHDVETDVSHAYRIAQVENQYGHRGSYYVQAYLLEDSKNVDLLLKMQQMGHEISYHYDVLDSCKGNIDEAISEFEKNLKLFKSNGYDIVTVCQHGNPIVEREGYHSNRDFFRNEKVRNLYPEISDIMVNFKDQVPTDYIYFSDAGRMFQLIFDPINNDIVNSDDKNIPYKDLDYLMNALDSAKGNIISIHPHRWTESAAVYVTKSLIFKVLKFIAKILIKIPVLNKLMSKYYYLAKKV